MTPSSYLVYESFVVENEFRSKPLKGVNIKSEGPEISHVFDAIKIGEKTLAENIFSRVSKQLLRRRLTHIGAKMHRSDDVDPSSFKAIHIVHQTVWLHQDSPDSHPLLKRMLETVSDTLKSHSMILNLNEVTFMENGGRWGEIFLIDAAKTEVKEVGEGLWAFSVKQKMGVR